MKKKRVNFEELPKIVEDPSIHLPIEREKEKERAKSVPPPSTDEY